MKIGFLGPRGTFTEEALDLWLKKQNFGPGTYEKIPYSTIVDVMSAVGKDVPIGIVPVENSLEGSINITVDSFIHDVEVMIKGEVILPVTHNLFAGHKASLEEIREVYSHPQALYQCRKFLTDKMPGARLRETFSTAEAAKLVSENDGRIAAIGSMLLAETYDLIPIAEGIQDGRNNMTRFFILSTEDGVVTGCDKTALIFSTRDQPGSLFECLKVFAGNEINLTRIESRPSKRVLGEYVFFIVVEGHRLDKHLVKAFLELEPRVGFYTILGSYPSFRI